MGLQISLSPLQKQLDLVLEAPADADIAPTLAGIDELLRQPQPVDAAASATQLVAEVAEGREAAAGGSSAEASPAC